MSDKEELRVEVTPEQAETLRKFWEQLTVGVPKYEVVVVSGTTKVEKP